MVDDKGEGKGKGNDLKIRADFKSVPAMPQIVVQLLFTCPRHPARQFIDVTSVLILIIHEAISPRVHQESSGL